METVTVIGLGKIGLPLAAVFANSGHFNVIGADVNEKVVETVNKGISHIQNEPGLDQLLYAAWKAGTLRATVDTEKAVSQSDVVVVIVPVLVDEKGNINYKYIDATVEEIGKGIRKGTLVIFETTLPAGDTRNRFGKRISELSGLTLGKDFYLGYSPERVYSNRILQDLSNYPKIVSGDNEKSLELVKSFYQKALNCDIISVSNLETAEFTKVAESVYRDVNIALANELAVYADSLGVNIKEVIHAANSQPFSHLHSPGVGVGGHCIPVYPYFFINNGLGNGIVQLSRKVNDQMAKYAVQQVEKHFSTLENKNILILGLAFRENVKETANSSTLLLADELKQKGAVVYVDDPLYTSEEIAAFQVQPFLVNDREKIDAIILQAYHAQYKDFDFKQFPNCQFVLDGRNVLDLKIIEGLGMKYQGIGVQ
ncbi:nucleotide sugar dehydrogenase [Ureibacillus thermophilus]|uniref:Nucleotide sugar dehydrogenase n=1 Tax=Ureibacillus thermophilus TaxID=367743 RepID=A0A4P6UXP2_9BACL|nr:nucleotide sugar dehydrogenase [Ureibacillus thermophilus]QBK26978.1 nucleotide sugar dehydrogenase [Ureibacillus thermophilus]